MMDSRALGVRLRPEEEAILLCVRAERNPEQQARLAELLAPGRMDWAAFWAEAAEQQVAPLVAQTLLASPLAASLPSVALDQARTVRLRTILHNLSAHAELRRIGAVLHARAIPVAPLKGTHVAERLYGSLGARQVGDIDILVPEPQLTEARAVLRELGYAPASGVTRGIAEHPFHGVPWVRQGGSTRFVVELHWGLSDPRFVTIDCEQLWQRIRAASSDREPLRPLPAEETLVFLALHLPKHNIGLLRLLGDIDRLVRREGSSLDWAFALELSRRWSVSAHLYFTLRWAHLLFGTPIPPGVLNQLAPPAWQRGLVELLVGLRAILRPPIWPHLRSNRFRLAYCAMLTPLGRCLHAYLHYLYASFSPSDPTTWGRAAGMLSRLTHGIGWTALVFAGSLVEQVRSLPWWLPAVLTTTERSQDRA
jgi:hypothetical protein